MNAIDLTPQESEATAEGRVIPDPAITFQSSPGHLRAVAHLYGLTTAPLAQARVLELGCGCAGNLLPFALAYPGARVVGVDPDSRVIQTAREAIAALNIGNIELFERPFNEIDGSLGEFDYVIAHDVYSSVEPAEAAELLRICRMNLAFEGVAYVSYETYPGAKMAESVRDAVLLHMHGAEGSEDQLAAAQTALTLFTEGSPVSGPLSVAMRAAADRMGQRMAADRGELLFAAQRYPAHYVEFVDAAAQFSLVCAGDAEPQIELGTVYGGNVSLTNSLLGLGKPKALRQQYLDFSVGRSYRRALLAHREREPQLLSHPNLERLSDLRWAGGFQRIASGLRDERQAHYLLHTDLIFSTDDAVVQLVLDTLGHVWPGSVPGELFTELVRERKLAPDKKSSEEAVREALKFLFERGIGRYVLDPCPYDNATGGKVTLIPGLLDAINKAVKQETCNFGAFNLWHEGVQVSFSPEEIEYLGRIAEGSPLASVIKKTGPTLSGLAPNSLTMSIAQDAAEPLVALLQTLRRRALLYASAEGWRDYLEAALDEDEDQVSFWLLYVGALARVGLAPEATSVSMQRERRQRAINNSAAEKEGQELLALALQKPDANLENRARRLIKQAPNVPVVWDALGTVLRSTGRAARSVSYFRHSLRLDPNAAMRFLFLAVAFRSVGNVAVAEVCCLRVIELSPSSYRAWNILGTCYRSGGRLHDAIACFRKCLKIEPNFEEAQANLGLSLMDLGDFSEANDRLRGVLSDTENRSPVIASHFFGLNYSPDLSAYEIFGAFRNYNFHHGEPLRKERKPHSNDRMIGRKIRVGYVSPDFRTHPVRLFLSPLFENHDHSRFEIFAYAELEREDEGTESFKLHADHWIPTAGMSDEALARRVRADKIDILVDLAGHTANNRLQVFARRPAPVQITWLGFGCTTGLTAIDYILMDENMAPPGSEDLFAEKIWRLSTSNFAYRPAKSMGDTDELPALANGHIRFLTLSRPIRFNRRVVSVWSEILHRLPDSRLVVDSHQYQSPRLALELRQKFGAHEIAADRLEIGYHSPPWDVIRGADISLDCFPHNSGTTLFESLYLGVPVITLADRPGVGRIGASTLNGLGRREWIATSEDEYIDKVVALASDIPALARIRAGLRAEMRDSALMDEVGFARKVENAFREMFKIWCEANP